MRDDIASQYRDWLDTWAAERTARSREIVARSRLREWGIEGITAPAIQGWIGSQRSKWTKATYYAAIKDFCAWLEAMGYIDESPIGDVRQPRGARSVPRPLSEPEVARVLGNVTGDMRAWVQLALLQGLRAHEIAKIRGADITETHLFVEGKGEVRAMLPTHRDVWTLAVERGEPGYWFRGHDGHIAANTVSVRTGRLFASLGIVGSIHRCRHTYATRLLRQGANIRTVQRLMRHASLATTQVYTEVTDDELRTAIDGLSA